MPKINITRDEALESQFRAWLESKPADETFNAQSTENCAFAQFLRESGICDQPNVRSLWWFDNATNRHGTRIPTPIIAAFKTPMRYPIMTFGAALAQFDAKVAELEPT